MELKEVGLGVGERQVGRLMKIVRIKPVRTRRSVVEVRSLADEIRIFEDERVIARHPLLERRRQRSLPDGHTLSCGDTYTVDETMLVSVG